MLRSRKGGVSPTARKSEYPKERQSRLARELKRQAKLLSQDIDFLWLCFGMLDVKEQGEIEELQMRHWLTYLNEGEVPTDEDMTDVYSKVSKIDEDGTLMALQFQEFLIIVQDYYMGLGASHMRNIFTDMITDHDEDKQVADPQDVGKIRKGGGGANRFVSSLKGVGKASTSVPEPESVGPAPKAAENAKSDVAITKATTKRALLTGLRNGSLHKAVEKMEADTNADTVEAGDERSSSTTPAMAEAGVGVGMAVPHTVTRTEARRAQHEGTNVPNSVGRSVSPDQS